MQGLCAEKKAIGPRKSLDCSTLQSIADKESANRDQARERRKLENCHDHQEDKAPCVHENSHCLSSHLAALGHLGPNAPNKIRTMSETCSSPTSGIQVASKCFRSD